jgi:riboflavin biosynthesis pyrimidine reductase
MAPPTSSPTSGSSIRDWALEILNRELGLERLLLEASGVSNGAFLRAVLIAEISLAICPAVDGSADASSGILGDHRGGLLPDHDRRCMGARIQRRRHDQWMEFHGAR